jgi:hypothetical protein
MHLLEAFGDHERLLNDWDRDHTYLASFLSEHRKLPILNVTRGGAGK